MPIIIDESTLPEINEKLLYPQRKRCRKCRKFLCFVVVDLVFCSYICADVEPPSDNPTDWPRKHWRRGDGGQRVEKKYFSYPGEASANDHVTKKIMNVYYCDYCHTFHLGHPPRITAA